MTDRFKVGDVIRDQHSRFWVVDESMGICGTTLVGSLCRLEYRAKGEALGLFAATSDWIARNAGWHFVVGRDVWCSTIDDGIAACFASGTLHPESAKRWLEKQDGVTWGLLPPVELNTVQRVNGTVSDGEQAKLNAKQPITITSREQAVEACGVAGGAFWDAATRSFVRLTAHNIDDYAGNEAEWLNGRKRITLADLRRNPNIFALPTGEQLDAAGAMLGVERIAYEDDAGYRKRLESTVYGTGEPRPIGSRVSFPLDNQHHTGTLAHHYGDGFCIVDVTGTGYCVAVKDLREPTSEPEVKPDPYKPRYSEKMIADMMAEQNKAFVPRFSADVEPSRKVGEVVHPWTVDSTAGWED